MSAVVISGSILLVRTIINNATPPDPLPGCRRSAAREVIAATAAAMPGAFSVDELAEVVKGVRPDTGVATVYRAVGALAEAGWLERVGDRDGTALFAHCGERCNADHHHHLVCTGCGAVAPAECPVSDAVRAAADSAGFTVTSHDLRLYGLCAKCSDRGRRAEADIAAGSDDSRKR
jgi:Fe2+ or Zn2+ uptake regulation protein